MANIGVLFIPPPSARANEPYGRACLVVEELSPEDPQHVTTTVFDDSSKPGQRKRLALYVDATVDSHVLVAAFNDKDRRLTNGWRPQLVELKEWEERRLPLAPVAWEWLTQADAFDVYIVFLERVAEGFETLQNLVAAMQDPQADPVLLDLQAKKLREEIARWMTRQEGPTFHAGASSSAWGGTLRGQPFPWPKMAQKATMRANGHGVLIYRHGL